MKNKLEGINSRLNDTEEWISKLEDRVEEINDAEHKKEKKRMKRNEDSLRDFWDNIKCANTSIMGVPEDEERDKGSENISEDIVAKNFPKLGKEMAIQVQEVHSPIED